MKKQAHAAHSLPGVRDVILWTLFHAGVVAGSFVVGTTAYTLIITSISQPLPSLMQNLYRKNYWEKRGRPKELYPDVSSKDAPVPPDLPVPSCDCGMPARVAQSRHPDTAARCFYTCNSLFNAHEKCYFFQWIDGPDKVDPRFLLFNEWWKTPDLREHFERWVPPPPNPPPMTDEERELAIAMRQEEPPRCYCGDYAVINPSNDKEFECPNVLGGGYILLRKCDFKEWLWGPKSHWPEAQEVKEKKKKRTAADYPPVQCKCGVDAQYGLVPSEVGVGYFCGHMVDYDESTRKCTWESFTDKAEHLREMRSRHMMGEKVGAAAKFVGDYLKRRKREMRQLARDMGVNSPDKVESKKFHLAQEKKLEEYKAAKAARVEEQLLKDLVDGLCRKIGTSGDYAAEEARSRYLEKTAMEAELRMEKRAEEAQLPMEDDDTSKLDELIELVLAEERAEAEKAEADEDEFWSQSLDEVAATEAAYFKQKADAESSRTSEVVIEESSDEDLLPGYVSDY